MSATIPFSLPDSLVDRERLRLRALTHVGPRTSGCWDWQSELTRSGYGRLRVGRRNILAHRLVYQLLVGDIAAGLQIDHVCRNRRCVNPWHLEQVTPGENVRRGDHNMRRKTHCPQGHAYDAANTAINSGSRTCRACDRARAAAYQRRRRNP